MSLFDHYISLTDGRPVLEALEHSTTVTKNILNKLTEPVASYSYQPEKWTIAQVLVHMLDVERIMAYRALRFSRQDTTPLPTFDDDDYVANAHAENRTITSLLKEFSVLRESTTLLFQSFTEAMFEFSDSKPGQGITVEKLGRIIAGHSMHHCNILVERYGV